MKVFFGDKIIHLVDSKTESLKPATIIWVSVPDLATLQTRYTKFISAEAEKEIAFYNENALMLQQWFMTMFKIIEAAGGLVMNDNHEYLFIFRKGKWDLPKGKIEEKETIEIAAVREVEEECGIDGLEIIKQLNTTYHIYPLKNEMVLKPTYWFEMKTDFKGALVPQTQEGITKVEWIKPEKVAALLPNAYESIREVMHVYLH